jgi:hypothetical protein
MDKKLFVDKEDLTELHDFDQLGARIIWILPKGTRELNWQYVPSEELGFAKDEGIFFKIPGHYKKVNDDRYFIPCVTGTVEIIKEAWGGKYGEGRRPEYLLRKMKGRGIRYVQDCNDEGTHGCSYLIIKKGTTYSVGPTYVITEKWDYRGPLE